MIKTKLLAATLLGVFMFTAGFGCKISGTAKSFKPITLEYWGVHEDSDAIKILTSAYSKRHPKIAINYRRFNEDEFKLKLLEAWAQGQGPDMFMVPSTKIREYLKFIEPMPATMQAPLDTTKGTIKKEVITTMETYQGFTPKQVRDRFLDVIADDVVIENKIYGLPYSIDALSVYYNRDLLKNANIPLPATTWDELNDQAQSLSKLDSDDNLVQSAIALGTTNNVPAAADIISILMMQIGVTVGNQTGVTFHQDPKSIEAIQYYLSFAEKGLKNYSWTSEMPDALQSFAAGKVAYFIGYPYHADLIRGANPSLNWDTIPLFKPAEGENLPTLANYWVTVVSKPRKGIDRAKERAEISWQYLSEATQQNTLKSFLSNKSRPRLTPLKALVTEQRSNPVLAPFAENILNAKTWYYGYNADLAEKYYLEMIDAIQTALANGQKPQPFLSAGASRISQTYSAPRE